MRQDLKYAVYLFVIFAAFRSVLEYLAGSFPLGYDSVNAYELWIRTNLPLQPITALFQSILYALNFLIGDPSLSVKIVNIFLEGAVASTLYLWVYSMTKKHKVAFFAALATCFYFPVLRIAWDLSMNMLSLVFGFGCLTLLGGNGRLRFALANALLVLSVFADIITLPVILFVIILRKDSWVRKAVPLVISGLMFLAALFYSTVSFGFVRFISLQLLPGGFLYLGWNSPLFMLYLAGPVVPFVALLLVKGPWKVDRELVLWTVGCIALIPVSLGYRFALLAFFGIVPIIVIRIFSVDPNKLLKVFLVVVLFLGFSYVAFSSQNPFPYYNLNQKFTDLMPTSLMLNTIPTYENAQVMGILSSNSGLFNCSTKLVTTSIFYDFILAAHVPACSIYVIGETGNVQADLSELVSYGQGHGPSPLYALWFAPTRASAPNFWSAYSSVEVIGSVGLFVYSPG